MRVAILVFALVAGVAACSPKAAPLPDPRVASWSALAQLPDWSGSWIKGGAQSTTFADCCIPGQGTAPLQPKYQKIRDAAAIVIMDGKPGGDNMAKCLPDGVPGILLHGVAFEFLFTPGKVTMVLENGEIRRIYTDGRSHPPADELYTSFSGHSTGRWEGDTLVVDTVGMDTRAMVFLVNAITTTKSTQVVERMKLKDKDTLQIDTTVTDPELFTTPYSYSLTYVRGLREEDFTVGCSQNNRDNGEKTSLVPPPEDE
jgi:hypothetical protein